MPGSLSAKIKMLARMSSEWCFLSCRAELYCVMSRVLKVASFIRRYGPINIYTGRGMEEFRKNAKLFFRKRGECDFFSQYRTGYMKIMFE